MNELHALNQEFSWLLDQTIEHKASDLHILASSSPMIRVDGHLQALNLPVYDGVKCNEVIGSFIGQPLVDRINSNRKELDFSFSYQGHRFRCNVFFSKGILTASIRLLPNEVLDMKALGVAPILTKLVERNQGLIIVAGPTGHGKSTTLAAVVNHLSELHRYHIITIEDPIEYLFDNKKSIISQREVGVDTPSFSSALRSALREDPDIVMLGEMRDLETVEAALQMAETGHLVLTTVHTNSAAQTADRIIGLFPAERQNQIRQQLSDMLVGIVSQRLLARVQGGRTLYSEILVANSAVRAIIREGKTHQLPNLIQTSAAEGMVSLEKALAEGVSKGEITVDDALAWAVDPKNLKMMIY